MILIIFIKHYYKTNKSIKIVDSINPKNVMKNFLKNMGQWNLKIFLDIVLESLLEDYSNK